MRDLDRLPEVLRNAKRWIDPIGWDSRADRDFTPSELSKVMDRTLEPAFLVGDGWMAWELVNCRDPLTGEIKHPWAREALEFLNSYAEVRAGGRSLLLIARTRKDFEDCSFFHAEIGYGFRFYFNPRPLQLTGERVSETTVSDRTAEIEEALRRLQAAEADLLRQFSATEACEKSSSSEATTSERIGPAPEKPEVVSEPELEPKAFSMPGFGMVSLADPSVGRETAALRLNEINRFEALWEFAKGEACVDTIPVRIQIGRSNKCNFKCVYCADHREGNTIPRSQLDGETWDRLMALIPRSGVAAFHGISEFLLDPEFFTIIKTCADAKVGITINTNGSICTPKYIDAIAGYPGHLEIIISVDAATADTYTRVRGWDFDRLLSNIKQYMDALRDRTEPYSVGMSFVIMKSNVHEMVPFVYLAKALGVSSVQFLRLNQYDSLSWEVTAKDGTIFNYQEECPSNFASLYNLHAERTRRVAKLLEIEAFVPPDLEESAKDSLTVLTEVLT